MPGTRVINHGDAGHSNDDHEDALDKAIVFLQKTDHEGVTTFIGRDGTRGWPLSYDHRLLTLEV